jgi:hypothetical protein
MSCRGMNARALRMARRGDVLLWLYAAFALLMVGAAIAIVIGATTGWRGASVLMAAVFVLWVVAVRLIARRFGERPGRRD